MAVIEKQTTRIQEHHKLILKNLTLTIILFTIFLHLCHYLSCSNGVRFITHRAIVPSQVVSCQYVHATLCIQVDMYVYFHEHQKTCTSAKWMMPGNVQQDCLCTILATMAHAVMATVARVIPPMSYRRDNRFVWYLFRNKCTVGISIF